MTETKPKAKLPEPIQANVKPSDYQPNKAEMEEEFDMPCMTEDELRDTFMRPFNRHRVRSAKETARTQPPRDALATVDCDSRL